MKTKSLILGFAGLMALSSCQKDECAEEVSKKENFSSVQESDFHELSLMNDIITVDNDLRASLLKNKKMANWSNHHLQIFKRNRLSEKTIQKIYLRMDGLCQPKFRRSPFQPKCDNQGQI